MTEISSLNRNNKDELNEKLNRVNIIDGDLIQ